jgi:hypothetical protein
MRDSRIALGRLVPYAGEMRRYAVSTRINQVQNDDVECARDSRSSATGFAVLLRQTGTQAFKKKPRSLELQGRQEC